MKSGDITVTNKRVLDALRNTTAKSVGVSPDTLSKNVASTLQLIKCRILRVYNTRQEVYVQIISNKKKVKAKILNPFLSEQVNISFTIDGIIHNDAEVRKQFLDQAKHEPMEQIDREGVGRHGAGRFSQRTLHQAVPMLLEKDEDPGGIQHAGEIEVAFEVAHDPARLYGKRVGTQAMRQ